MEKARCNTELYSNLSEPLNNVKPSNFLESHQSLALSFRPNKVSGEIFNTDMCKDVSTPVGRST